jgi:hypothetical protein
MTWGVWCRAWGGVTGERSSWLKENGSIRVFDTADEAEKVATELNRKRPPHAKAFFSYTATSMSGLIGGGLRPPPLRSLDHLAFAGNIRGHAAAHRRQLGEARRQFIAQATEVGEERNCAVEAARPHTAKADSR